jgi:hypothetical protein
VGSDGLTGSGSLDGYPGSSLWKLREEKSSMVNATSPPNANMSSRLEGLFLTRGVFTSFEELQSGTVN